MIIIFWCCIVQTEIDRLRQQAAQREAKLYAERQAAAVPPSSAIDTKPPHAAATLAVNLTEKLTRTLKVSWLRRMSDYTASQLRAIFAAHGAVEDVVIREGKKKKGSALVVMATGAGAQLASQSVSGELDNPLLVVPFNKVNTRGGGAWLAGCWAWPSFFLACLRCVMLVGWSRIIAQVLHHYRSLWRMVTLHVKPPPPCLTELQITNFRASLLHQHHLGHLTRFLQCLRYLQRQWEVSRPP